MTDLRFETEFEIPESGKKYQDILKSGGYQLAIFDGDRLASYAIFMVIYETADLLYVETTDEYKRQGLATKLLVKAISELQKTEVEKIFLEVAVSNYNALDLYEKLGFETIMMLPDYYGSMRDGLRMIKSI